MRPFVHCSALLIAGALACGTTQDPVLAGANGGTAGSENGAGGALGGAPSTGAMMSMAGGSDSGGAPAGGSAGSTRGGAGGEVDLYPLDDTLRLDHVQVKGTHNSYHIEPAFPVDPSHAYSHVPLDEQLDQQGVRAFEIDLHLATDLSYDVYHIAVVDNQTTCGALEECLGLIKTWSDDNPDHLPVMVWFEMKDNAGGLPIVDLAPIDAVIEGVFPRAQLLTPDDVRGSYDTLREAITTEGWPTLGEVRGRVAFMVLDTGIYVDAYTQGGTSLAGRTMFIHTEPSDFDLPYAAVSKINDPKSANIADAHAAGILVASNICGAGDSDEECDADLAAAKTNGVHMLMDDFPAPVGGMSYWLNLPDGNPARCNEQTAPSECTSALLENL